MGIDAWLDRKYSNLEQATAIQGREVDARSALLRAQAAAVPEETYGRVQSELGSAAAGFGAGAYSEAQATATPGLAASEQALRYGQAGLAGSEAAKNRFGMEDAPAELSSIARGRSAPYSPAGTPLPFFNLTLTPSHGSANPAPVAPGAPGTTPAAPAAAQRAPQPQQLGTPGFQGGVSVLSPQSDIDAYKKARGFSRGTSKVPGKGSGKIDTVAAKLAPGEAVLNKGAAEHLGRHTIDLLNALGEQKMNMDDSASSDGPGTTATDQGTTQGFASGTSNVAPSGDRGPTPDQSSGGRTAGRERGGGSTPDEATADGATPHYAKGTSKVPAKKAAPSKGKAGGNKEPAPVSISPSLLAALMQMGGKPNAGGMPAPGAAAPMPMPMPMSGGPA